MTAVRSVLAAVAAAIGLAACHGGGSPDPAVRRGNDQLVEILATARIYGELKPCG